MSKLRILDHSGDTVVEWAIDAAEAVAEAERIFTEKRAEGHLAVAVTEAEPGGGEVITTFDPTAETIILMPRLVGG